MSVTTDLLKKQISTLNSTNDLLRKILSQLKTITTDTTTTSTGITKKSLDAAIKSAYEYAHAHCNYGPTDRCFPPMEDGLADCVGLVLRAFYTLGTNTCKRNINQALELCEISGLKKSTNFNDVAKYHCIVFMCPKNDPKNVSHVYYSLGGKSVASISKYDLGSNERIRSTQPFNNVPANQWTDKYNFMCLYHI